jgi:hypothetical protein
MTSPAFSLLAACPDPVLTFDHDYVIDDRAPSQDRGLVEISTDGGATWQTLRQYTGGYQAGFQPQDASSPEWTDLTWEEETIDLAPYAAGDNLRLRFRLEVDQFGADRGWILDNVMVKSGAPPSPIFLPLIIK